MKRKNISLTRESVLKSLVNAGIKMERRNDHDGFQLIDETQNVEPTDVLGIIEKPATSVLYEYTCDVSSQKQKCYFANAFANVG